ncbi:MAG: DUF805 domain-containing protein [Flavobacteriaceae bacterium]|nr:MAG: DUF805 domain-containing protein [Flavobacteriaceae bacterium]
MEWFIKCMKQYADFKGRSRRQEFWMFQLICILIEIILDLPTLLGIPFSIEQFTVIVSSIFSWATLIPSLAVGWRRMHDIGKSGWYILFPFYNIYLAAKNGDEGTNQYGLDPKNPVNEIEDLGKPELS